MPKIQSHPASSKKSEFESLTNILIKAKDLPAATDAKTEAVTAVNGNGYIAKASSVTELLEKTNGTPKPINGHVAASTKNSALNGIPFKRVRKRDGRITNFEPERIVNAITKAMDATHLRTEPFESVHFHEE